MEITLYNIQGFRGKHQYTLDDHVTIINSKENGVGKTTLYDCLKMLSDSTIMDKEEQNYFLNLNEKEGMFSVYKNGVTNGFIIMKGTPPMFFRQYDGEEIERSGESFPTAASDIGILRINDTLLNIFSKEVDLFSTSDGRKNYQLVKEITTHQETEEMLELVSRSINVNKQDLDLLRAERKGIQSQLDNLLYFPATEQLEELLNDTVYEEFEVFAESFNKVMDKLSEVETYNFNSGIVEIVKMQETLDRLQHTEYEVLDAELLRDLLELTNCLDRIQTPISTSVKINPLEQVTKMCETLGFLKVTPKELNVPISALEGVVKTLESIKVLRPKESVTVDANLPYTLSKICIALGQMNTNHNRAESYERIVTENRKRVQSVRVDCPIRKEVYLIDGRCSY